MSDHGVRYMVATADPAGFWLMPCGETDPNYWAYMELLCPIDEISRLHAKIERLKLRDELVIRKISYALAIAIAWKSFATPGKAIEEELRFVFQELKERGDE